MHRIEMPYTTRLLPVVHANISGAVTLKSKPEAEAKPKRYENPFTRTDAPTKESDK